MGLEKVAHIDIRENIFLYFTVFYRFFVIALMIDLSFV